jgi:hypothetical protein
MIKKSCFIATSVAMALIAGCILSDQLTTITVQPDGSADLVKFQSNLRSSEAGAKGAEELKRFVDDFDAHRDPDYLQIRQAGGEVLEARWVRRGEPPANLLTAKFSTASTFLAYLTIKDDQGRVVAQPRFKQAGKRRRLSIVIQAPSDQKQTELAGRTIPEARQEQANGISETRIVVAGGQIVDSRGFTVAADKHSALVEPAEIRDLLQKRPENLELFLEWELTGA